MKTPTILITALASLAVPAMAQTAQTGTGETDGYRLVWQDLFDGDVLNRDRWNIEVNGDGGGNHELQYYSDSPENVSVGDDGRGNSCLILTAIRRDYNNKSFTSGRVNSKNLISFKHGKIEASIRLPKTADGLWPAFWMMGNDYDQVGWPRCGETDILEMGNADGIRNGTQDRYFNGAMHWGQGWPAASHAKASTKNYSLQDDEYHLFTVIWDEDAVSMFVDLDVFPKQTPYFKMTIPCDDPDNEWSPGNYFHKENFILFNVAVGGDFTGIHDPAAITALNDENGQKASMYINYIKIYQKGTDDESLSTNDPGDDTGTSGLTDLNSSAENTIMVSHGIASCPYASIEVYDITGNLMNRGFGSVSLEGLSPGIAIIVAVRPDGSKSVLKTSIIH